mmetsp:Transcript_226/g.201  ORF Transcript_226/g.201 Transcript_226/m.201 type:complete len:229 (+) Transcript_226:101-787(+)
MILSIFLAVLLAALVNSDAKKVALTWDLEMGDDILDVNVDDILELSWSGIAGLYDHNVIIHKSLTCETTPGEDNPISPNKSSVGNVAYTFTDEDASVEGKEMFFSCDYGNHCERGMFLMVKVYPKGCSICGEGQVVGNAGAIYDFNGSEMTCEALEKSGQRGQIPLDQCGTSLSSLVTDICGCETAPTLPPTSTDQTSDGVAFGIPSFATHSPLFVFHSLAIIFAIKY